jgi:hypothetical protein
MNNNSENAFLSGPRSRWKEFLFSLEVLFQFIKGFRNLHFVGPCITIFGSARFRAMMCITKRLKKLRRN